MPLISRTFIKAGMVYFGLSLIMGLLFEIDAVAVPGIMPLFWHALMLGWITQIIMGVSIWMFPGRNREEGFKPQKWGWLTFIFLNTGLPIRFVAEPLSMMSSSEWWNILLVIAAVLHVLAGVTYLIEMWPRILSKKKQRERRKRKRRNS